MEISWDCLVDRMFLDKHCMLFYNVLCFNKELTIDKICDINIRNCVSVQSFNSPTFYCIGTQKQTMTKYISIEYSLLEMLGLAIKYIPASRIFELVTKYVPVPSQEEFEASKSLTIQDQDKWDRKYMAALKIQRAKEIIC